MRLITPGLSKLMLAACTDKFLALTEPLPISLYTMCRWTQGCVLQGRFEEALQDYSAAIRLNPRHCRAFYNRAFSNDRLRRYDDAVADYTRALEIQPGNATAFHNRASLFERLGRYIFALAQYVA